jgi:hypothetical protein
MDKLDSPPSILCTLDKGSLIGEIDAFMPIYRKNGVKTRNACDIIRLTYASTKPILENNPESRDKVAKVIKVRDF